MLLLSINKIYINIQSNKVELVKVCGWSGRMLQQEVLDCSVMMIDTFDKQLELVKKLLEKYGESLNCHVVLSNCFVRHLIIPDVDLSLSERELEVLAKHCFSEIYGQKTEAWKVKVDPIHHVACAIDTTLIESLREICKIYGCKLQSIQSYLVSAFNQIRQILGKKLICLIQVDNLRLTIVVLDGVRWLRLSSLQYDGDWSLKIYSIIRREVLLSGLDIEQVKIYVQYQQPEEHEVILNDNFLKFEVPKAKPNFLSKILLRSGFAT